jgi:hypothetical protein
MLDLLDVNGEPPALRGTTLQELLVQSFWYDGELEEEANVVFLKSDDAWNRLYFDCGIIFWRPDNREPQAYDFRNDDGTVSEFRIRDLGRERDLVGQQLEDYSMEPVDGGSQVTFRMQDGTCFGFENVNDSTRIMTQQDKSSVRGKPRR